MPLIVEGSRVPTRWLERKPAGRVVPIDSRSTTLDCIRIALINNMPDAALEDTELQFFDLLDEASGNLPVVVKLFSLTGVPRTERGMRHLNSFYSGIDELWSGRFDALIMTGTEPQQPNLRQEPYWPILVSVLDWAEKNTVSTILSCLAAHAGVLRADGIERCRLGDKRFGVFDFIKTGKHVLTDSTGEVVRFPHSRWNDLQADALKSCGYRILTQSSLAGVDCFMKRSKNSLFLHFQGHPEYTEQTLLKEYRRDIKRFLHGERETFPTMPHGYFDAEASKILLAFREAALAKRGEQILAGFPERAIVDRLHNTWRSFATCIYRNWLQYVWSRKSEIKTFPAISETYNDAPRKRTALH